MIFTMGAFLLAIFILVSFHEYGHFQVARWCGVKVLRFSFGFGKVLALWRDKQGTEYTFSLIPLGGYVKMLDESEEEVADSEKHLAFNRKSVFVRICVVAAGPLFNFILAFVLLWCASVIGIQSLAPIVSSTVPGSIAEKAGISANQEILAVDNQKINSWRDFQYAMMGHIGSLKPATLTLKSVTNGQQTQINLPLQDWHLNAKQPNLLESFGIKSFIPHIPPLIGTVLENSPAEKAGFRVSDEILSVDNVPVKDWFELVDFVKKNPDKEMQVSIKRNFDTQVLSVTTGKKMSKEGVLEGYLGLLVKPIQWPQGWLRTQQENPLNAIPVAFNQLIQLTVSSVTLMGRLITGKLPLNNISGPVGVAQGASLSAKNGIVHYLFFLALMSISLGVLNLLPIPMLDGGHLVYYALEIFLKRPVSLKFKTVGVYIGVLFIGMLMVIALTNDIARLVSS